MKKLVHTILLIILLVSGKSMVCAQTTTLEYQVKATFIFNFTQFIEWPSSSFTKPDSPFIIGILGDDPFGAYLKEIVSAEKVNSHPITIQKYKDTSEVKNCHILFISITQAGKLESALKSIPSKNMLTVGDAGSFIQKGGMIKFYEEEDKIKLQINPSVTEKAGLTISSKLLRLAKIVTADKS